MAKAFFEFVDEVRELDSSAKLGLLELIRRWLIEERRDEILKNAVETEAAYLRGEALHGSVDDLLKDLRGAD